jgi:taurine dioxygenase
MEWVSAQRVEKRMSTARVARGVLSMKLEIRQLSASVGAEVLGVHPHHMTADTVEELQRLWREHLTLVFRELELSEDGQMEFAAHFGVLGDVAKAKPDQSASDRHVMMIANRPVEGKENYLPDGEMWFHYDQMYLPVPIRAGLLYAISVPKTGGATRFANAVSAYAALPDDLKARLDGLRAKHVYDSRATTRLIDEGDVSATSATHPVVISHPTLGVPSLFISPLMTHRVLGLPDEESRDLLATLYSYLLERDELIYEHHWHVGDLVLWDNRAVLHARTDFDPAEPRILRRLSLAGDGPPEPWRL